MEMSVNNVQFYLTIGIPAWAILIGILNGSTILRSSSTPWSAKLPRSITASPALKPSSTSD